MNDKSIKIKRALLSVSDKTGLLDLAKVLEELKIEIISTGGTLKALSEGGITAKDISEFSGSPEMMQGRVKTLHPKVHGGILSRRELDLEEVEKNNIQEIDLVVVNLYPFEETSHGLLVITGALGCTANISRFMPKLFRSFVRNNDTGHCTVRFLATV